MFILEDISVFDRMQTQNGKSLADLASEKSILLIFLRHFGCIFCKETMQDIDKIKDKLSEQNIEIVFVHMSDLETGDNFFAQYDFKIIHHVSDPDCNYYREFGLEKGDFRQLFGFKTFIGSARALSKGNAYGRIMNDSYQMPGVFFLQDGKIAQSFIHKSVGDSPNYLAMCGL